MSTIEKLGKSLSADSNFRLLSKNDIHQTTEQWKERTLQRLGEVSGQWTAWVEKDDIPKLPETRPRPPIKPSSDTLLLEFKTMIRSRILQERITILTSRRDVGTRPTLPTIDDIPMPTDYEAWTEYEDLNFIYQSAVRDYERREKLALETYPRENRKVFPSLINCISDTSVQDLRRSPEGSRLFADHDAYGFFKLAIIEHDYLPPAMSSAALSRAREDFEKLQQKSEDTLTEHINEFRRRLEHLIKIRDPDGGSPYADFDLRDLLLRSLYKPLWSPWIASRRSNANLPTTFENLILALKQAESDMILEGTTIFDAHMPAAHATKVASPDPSPAASTSRSTPSRCQCCGARFSPKRSIHVRCDKCQADFVASRKSERKSGKTTPSTTKKKIPPKSVKTDFKKIS